MMSYQDLTVFQILKSLTYLWFNHVVFLVCFTKIYLPIIFRHCLCTHSITYEFTSSCFCLNIPYPRSLKQCRLKFKTTLPRNIVSLQELMIIGSCVVLFFK